MSDDQATITAASPLSPIPPAPPRKRICELSPDELAASIRILDRKFRSVDVNYCRQLQGHRAQGISPVPPRLFGAQIWM